MIDSKLRYLAEAVKEGSMRAAGEKLGIAVSSVSRQIAQLERDFGVPLIEHGRRTVQATEAGVIVMEFYRERMSQHEWLLTQLRDLNGLQIGHVVLAVGEGFITSALANLITDFTCKYPGITFSIPVAGTLEISRMIVDDDAHIGLVFHAQPDLKLQPHLSVPQPIKLILPFNHPLTAKPDLTFADLADLRMCALPKRFRIRQLLGLAESDAGSLLSFAVESDSLQVLKMLALSGEFATFLPELAVAEEITARRLVARTIPSPILNGTAISIIVRSGRQLPPAAVRLVRTLSTRLRGAAVQQDPC